MPDGTVLMEMADAAGLHLLDPAERDVMGGASTHVPVIVVAGEVGPCIDRLYIEGVTAILGINSYPVSRSLAMRRARSNLRKTGEAIGRLICGLVHA